LRRLDAPLVDKKLGNADLPPSTAVMVAARGAREGRMCSRIELVRVTSTLLLARLLDGRREMLDGFLRIELAEEPVALGRRGTVGGMAHSRKSDSSTGVSPGAGEKVKGAVLLIELEKVVVRGARLKPRLEAAAARSSSPP
jgi:hypothetical protein